MTSQILDYSDEDFRQLANKIIEDGSVVLHEQNLTREQHVEVCERIGECEKHGYWTLQSGIFPENVASIRMHEKLGFRKIGFRERIGQLNGIWKDNILMEKRSKKIG